MKELDNNNIPEHVAIIMDGNGRWAKQQNKLRIFGHTNGVAAVRRAVSYARQTGVKFLTLYAFSSENWNRPEQEVSALMTLFMQALDREVKKLHKNNIRLKIIAANYGGCWDIVQATQQLAEKVKNNEISVSDINESLFQQHLVTQDEPPVDLLIRTSGEQRISNFLLWQIAYAELCFLDVLWPDFSEKDFNQAIACYQQRHRRFGGTE